MAKTKISEYDAISANNTDVDSINIAEGCAPSGINNAIREVMAHLKDFQTGASGDSLTVGGNLSVTGTVTIPDNAISGDKVEGGTINAITINTLTAGQANFGDNAKAIFGAGSDLQIYHDGTTSKIDGAVTLTSNVTLGDASTDTVQVNGYMGVGVAPSSAQGIKIGSTGLTSAFQYGIFSNVSGNSSATTFIAGVATSPTTEASAFTAPDVAGFRASTPAKGAGSTITNLHGLYIADQTVGTNNYGITSLVSSGTNKWNIYASGTAANYFAGNVGIGTTAPSSFGLSLEKNGDVGITLKNQADASGKTWSIWQDNYDGTLAQNNILKVTYGTSDLIAAKSFEVVINETSEDVDFRIESDTNSHAFFLEGSTGNVGIGTSSPSALLTVNNVSGNLAANFVGITGAYAGFWNGATNVGYIGSAVSIVGSGASADLALRSSAGNIVFATGGSSERLRIDSAGNLGLGVTPSGWGSGLKTIDIGAGAALTNANSTSDTWLSTNAYYTTQWLYKNTGVLATNYAQTNGTHRWYTAPSGTAGTAISFTQAMTLTSAGELLVGYTSTAGYKMTVGGGGLHINGSNHGSMSSGQQGFTIDYASGLTTLRGRSNSSTTRGQIAFNVIENDNGNDLESMRIDSSGNLLVGKTSSSLSTVGVELGSGYSYFTSSGINQYINRTSDGETVRFYRSGTQVGSISVTTSATSYNTSSDYRLKENWVAVADASTRVNALKPVNFAWKASGTRVDGFLAHELAEVVPEAVTGEKDAVDADGNPVYQGIDQSKLVPLLTAALQEALAQIESLTARVSALEGN